VFSTTLDEVVWQVRGGPSRWVCAGQPPRAAALRPTRAAFPQQRFAGLIMIYVSAYQYLAYQAVVVALQMQAFVLIITYGTPHR
jgi:hypothetical protein